MDDAQIKTQIKLDEALRLIVYPDTEGIPTVGWGHADKSMRLGASYTRRQCEDFFTGDWMCALRDYNSLGLSLSPVRRAVIIMMLFNLGLTRFFGFKQFLGALAGKDYLRAGAEMLDSVWRTQVKNRAHRLAAAMITGVWV